MTLKSIALPCLTAFSLTCGVALGQVPVSLDFAPGSDATLVANPETSFTVRLAVDTSATTLPLTGYDLRMLYDPNQLELLSVEAVTAPTANGIPAPEAIPPASAMPDFGPSGEAIHHVFAFAGIDGSNPAVIDDQPTSFQLFDATFRTTISPAGIVSIFAAENDRGRELSRNPALLFQDNSDLSRLIGFTEDDYPNVVFASAVQGLLGAADLDGDGVADGVEPAVRIPAAGSTNGALYDSDGDGLADLDELNGSRAPGIAFNFAYDVGLETDPRNADTDGDGIPDGVEVLLLGSDPLDENSPASFVDADSDGLPASIDPNDSLADSDGDGYLDAYEAVKLGLAAVTDDAVKPGLGDVNGDEIVDSTDGDVLTGLVAGSQALDSADVENYDGLDLDGDGQITLKDALAARKLAEAATTVPVP